MESDLANYIAEELKILHPFYQWKIVKDTKKQLIEVLCTFRLEVDDEVQVQDMLGTNNESGYLQFEEIICFYDPAISHVQPQNYLKAISFDSQLGIEKGLVNACIKQLNIIMTQGYAELKEFINDDKSGEFALTWNDTNLNQSIETLKQTERYEQKKLMMNLEKSDSLVEQFTGEGDYDGVERI